MPAPLLVCSKILVFQCEEAQYPIMTLVRGQRLHNLTLVLAHLCSQVCGMLHPQNVDRIWWISTALRLPLSWQLYKVKMVVFVTLGMFFVLLKLERCGYYKETNCPPTGVFECWCINSIYVFTVCTTIMYIHVLCTSM